MGVDTSFEDFLNQLNLDFPTYINSLCQRFTKPTFFFKRHVKNIKTNVYAIKVAMLLETYTNIQFILDPFATTSYYTSYLPKINIIITTKFQTIIKKCENENVDANLRVRKLGNVFLNVCLINIFYICIFTYLSCLNSIIIF